LQRQGVEGVFRLHQRRPVDFRRGRRLGPEDHVVVWTKPKRPAWLAAEVYEQLPETLEVRQVRVRGNRPGVRGQTIGVGTTLREPSQASRHDLMDLYRRRWEAELDLRSLKQTMQMSILRGKTPAMVRKEVWAHFLAYNLMRTVMAQAAYRSDREPRRIS